MGEELTAYLEDLRRHLHLGPGEEGEILAELRTHLEELVGELCQKGVEEGEAIRLAAAQLGPPTLLARQLYPVYAQEGWKQAFLAALPHFLVALFFMLHLWQSLPYLVLLLGGVMGISLWGWWQGKPLWLFPWLGYSLIPILGASLFLLSLPPWSYLALIAYVPLAWALLSSIVRQAVRRDWLYGSLVLLPVPVMLGWLVALEVRGGLGGYVRQGLRQADPWIALSFLTLALTTAAFVRAGQRRLRAGALLTPELVILVLVALSTGSFWGFLGLTLLALLSLGFLLSPALLPKGGGYREPR